MYHKHKQLRMSSICFLFVVYFINMKRRFKQWWATISTISIKEQSTPDSTQSIKERPRYMKLKIYVLDWDRHKKVAGLPFFLSIHSLLYSFTVFLIKQHIKNKLVERAKVGHGSLWVACVVTWLVSLLIGRLYRETDTVLKKLLILIKYW